MSKKAKSSGPSRQAAVDAPPTALMEAAGYREIMRHHAGAVTVIAVGLPGARTGLTATAVCSLSDSPAMILACVNRSASAHAIITATRCFSINLLASEQQDVAMRFAGREGLAGEDRFETGAWTTLSTGAPVLEGALANLDCELAEELNGLTHTIFIGAVKSGRVRAAATPLLYFRGEFRNVDAGGEKAGGKG